MEILGTIIFFIVLIAGVVIIPFGVAGTFIIAADALVYGLLTGFERISVTLVVVLFGVAVALEIFESVFGALLAKRFGGSKWAAIGAIIGGFLGAIAGSPVAPVIGTLLGGFFGAFAGAVILELITSGDSRRSLHAGIGAFIGAFTSKIAKIIIAIIMAVSVVISFF